MEPKNRERLSSLRRHNRRMPRRRLDIPVEKVSYKHPEFLAIFAKMHRKITREIKRARALNLLP